jgi:hypothetical protein
MLPVPVNPKLEFLFDEVTGAVIHSKMLQYRLSWYNMGRVIAVTPNNNPEITYLVDVEDNKGKMSCTCDSFMFKPDPQLVGPQQANQEPCRHILLARLMLKRGLLQ